MRLNRAEEVGAKLHLAPVRSQDGHVVAPSVQRCRKEDGDGAALHRNPACGSAERIVEIAERRFFPAIGLCKKAADHLHDVLDAFIGKPSQTERFLLALAHEDARMAECAPYKGHALAHALLPEIGREVRREQCFDDALPRPLRCGRQGIAVQRFVVDDGRSVVDRRTDVRKHA